MKNRNQPVETSEHFNYNIKTYMQYHWGWWWVLWLWKTSCLVTFPKTKHPKHLSNYRPVIVMCWSMNSPEERVSCGPTCQYHMSLSLVYSQCVRQYERMSVSDAQEPHRGQTFPHSFLPSTLLAYLTMESKSQMMETRTGRFVVQRIQFIEVKV